MYKRDIDTVTNLILNNEYKLNEDKIKTNKEKQTNKVRINKERTQKKIRSSKDGISNKNKSNREGVQNKKRKEMEGTTNEIRIETEGTTNRIRSVRQVDTNRVRTGREGLSNKPREVKEETSNKIRSLKEGIPNRTGRVRKSSSNKKRSNTEVSQIKNKKQISNGQIINSKVENNKNKNKKKIKNKILLIIKILGILIILGIIFIYLFFKTSLFQKYKEIWVETAMSTMNHQYLATWFLSDEEINKILHSLKVVNEEDSNSNEIIIDELLLEDETKETEKKEEIVVEKIKGKNYVGHVLIISDPTKVKLVDTRKSNRGTQLSEILRNKNAIAGINAGGFTDDGGVGQGHQLCKATIINQKLLYGNKNTKYSLIGLSTDHKLVLGKYTYHEAISERIDSAVEFGPYLIVNGKNQVTNSNSGGIHPRTAIGQRKDGTFIFVVVDGRQPGYSLGTNLLELQNIFNRYDAYNAANLDGGSSSTMCYDGKRINKTSTPMGERYLPNAFIVEK